MKINQAAELAGITSKNIRFYEDQGLIKPGRDPQNGYREYSMEDVEQLLRIRLLRQIGIPCETIRQLQSGELGFDKCMSDHMEELSRKEQNLGHMKEICRMLSDDVDDLSEIRASVYLEKMSELEKGGATFVNIRMSDTRKRKTGAIIAAAAVIAVTLLMAVLIFRANSEDPAPAGVIIIIFVVFAAVIIGVTYALRQRLDEVGKGEIDEASKY